MIDWLDLAWFLMGMTFGGLIVHFVWVGFERSMDKLDRRMMARRNGQPRETGDD